ncbi:MAG: hypothetical protein ACKOC4_09135 [Planctomycetia bacterium]
MNGFPSGLRRGRQAAFLILGLAAALVAATAEAQGGRAAFAAGAQGGGGNAGTLPFNSIYRRPALSPYQQLYNFADNPLQNQNVYQQMVMPQLQQQQQQIEQLQQRRQMGTLQNQVQQIQRDTSSRQIDESIRPTGHRATYMNYSHFYVPR